MSYLDYANPKDSYLSGNDPANNGYNQPDDDPSQEKIKVGVYGSDGKKLKWDNKYFTYTGTPDEPTKQIFDAMLLTPIGILSVKGYINHVYFEFKFNVVDDSLYDDKGKPVNGFTDPSNDPVYIVKICTKKLGLAPSGLYDRFEQAGIIEKLNVVGVHEKNHIKRTSDDSDEKIPVHAELQARFEYYLLYDDSSPLSSWLPNYTIYFSTWYDQTSKIKNEFQKLLNDASNEITKSGMGDAAKVGNKKDAISTEINKIQ